MTISELKEIVNNPEMIGLETNSIILSEMAVECYFNRLCFIALRLEGIGYNQARFILQNQDNDIHKIAEKAMNMILTKDKYLEFKKDKAFQILRKLFLEYSLPRRNYIAHGRGGSFNEETIKACIKININYIREFESYLYRLFGKSVFDRPSAWGAKKVSKTFSKQELSKYEIKEHHSINDSKMNAEYSKIPFSCHPFVF